ncbi:MAG: arginine--tRNA ligase [Candidatus Levybacteria bacterium RIFCSPHIGHO2_12_FULL_38_12]|nr:MAG: arginine--tRNA ligase [Candidatus Levybacteria bacterium RIFCSPHIGHO2_01_FULL_38_12]OGH22722.1 MAG: arginine--tRNA ligase [Candidatus Levybacteria bacterium RIFCSPHIGHO2_12_FULL_38_12]OGH44862.1 MAG: arginine--tRNA ligase [Candidatus Levybacteria bacterium RIFCSPLOWO2_02_FULL_37_18]OGH51232.1 MAG: arginine--tRNA ligase [Candidatus Levybacteria bacterium RIFCSPLOWO2_12_FULL_37_7]
MKHVIRKEIERVLKDMGLVRVEFTIEHPGESSHGDYSSNIALVVFGEFEARNSKIETNSKNIKLKTPLELAQEIVKNFKFRISSIQQVQDKNFKFIDRVEVAGPGFINFWLTKEYLFDSMIRIIKAKEEFGKGGGLKNKKVMVEYTDPNPFKEFHIGHLYSNAVGESLSRLFEAQGAEVRRANYQGDVGMHVAKSLYGILQQFRIHNSQFRIGEELQKLEKESLNERIEFLGQAYVLGAKAYEEDEKVKQEIHVLNKQIYELDPKIKDIYLQGRQWSLDYFETIYKRLGTKFDGYYFESEAGEIGLQLVYEYQKKGVFAESEGAVIFPGEKYNLHNRVFVNSLGLPTYEAKELGLNKKKYEDYPFDASVIVTGNEINEYFKVLLCAMEQVIPEVAQKTKHIGHGMVRLPQGKMSSRTGNVITGEWLLDEAKRRISSKFSEMADKTAEMVAVGAVKYALLKSGIGRDIEFSFDESISLEGNSGSYLQYTYVRTQSVLSKFQINTNNQKDLKLEIGNWKLEIEEENILRLLYRFPEVVEEASGHLAPNYICSYLFELAQAFNLFYQKHKILDQNVIPNLFRDPQHSDNEMLNRVQHDKNKDDTKRFRILLTASVGQVLYNGLYMLGIAVPERM